MNCLAMETKIESLRCSEHRRCQYFRKDVSESLCSPYGRRCAGDVFRIVKVKWKLQPKHIIFLNRCSLFVMKSLQSCWLLFTSQFLLSTCYSWKAVGSAFKVCKHAAFW